MKINLDSISDITEYFYEFENSMQGGNYVFSMGTVSFKYQENDNFSLDDLKSLLKEGQQIKIGATLKETSWNETVENINNFLKYSGNVFYNPDSFLDIAPNDVHKKRIQDFWAIVKKHFKLPPAKIYKYEAQYPGSFGDYIMWEFGYVFLSNSQGLLLHAGASD